ncbi:hypothetical protein G3480_19495 [Thiorhodococcus mannitoliphagus]|uniref:Uncharacterized protein n=1 Tax=Thiorhodococcus mannitoliphagus TaxID=329406 RepID=A0A6P1E365_9GAMM|nr:hypothetical protein [Thiorhodococcus mannitoliphagus]NEX22464.1 hypothetical protein [Thiorhodococcus mannitoliphagus]
MLFLIWSLFVGSLDNILKPILLGRGVQVPIAYGGDLYRRPRGILSAGIIGLFVGVVVLVLGYKLFLACLHRADEGEPERS